jgi:two-component system sensor histidine kinase PhoQ
VRPRSLSARLLVGSAVLLPLFLGLAGYGLEGAFRDALREAEFEKGKVQSYLLLGAAELEDERIALPEALPEPRYGQLGSGLYAQVRGRDGAAWWQSRSADLLDLPLLAPALVVGETAFGEARAGDTPLFFYRHGLAWEASDQREVPFELVVWHDQATYWAELGSYRRSLARSLALVALLLVVLQLAVLRWGLRPLRHLASDLERVRKGEATRLTGQYSAEIDAVTENLNQLLASERSRRERYRDTLSNLAHSLKTPLAVLQGALETNASPQVLRSHLEQELGRMKEIVAHQLGRAQRRGAPTLGVAVAIAPVVERLTVALSKVYREKEPHFAVEIDRDLTFQGDEGDLMELLGNLLDNCCKHGGRYVRVSAERAASGLTLRIGDDGPGIAPEARAATLERGARIDQATPGQGIGLAVAREIAENYGGSLSIETSEVGGALFVVNLR